MPPNVPTSTWYGLAVGRRGQPSTTGPELFTHRVDTCSVYGTSSMGNDIALTWTHAVSKATSRAVRRNMATTGHPVLCSTTGLVCGMAMADCMFLLCFLILVVLCLCCIFMVVRAFHVVKRGAKATGSCKKTCTVATSVTASAATLVSPQALLPFNPFPFHSTSEWCRLVGVCWCLFRALTLE